MIEKFLSLPFLYGYICGLVSGLVFVIFWLWTAIARAKEGRVNNGKDECN